MEGAIKVLKEGYGFISVEGKEKDTFFHATSLQDVDFDSLRVGDTLSFETEVGDNGKEQAINVTLVADSEEA